MPRPAHRLACTLLALVALAVPAQARGQAALPEPAGPDFEAILLADARVTPPIKAALRSGAAFAEAAAFGDLTRDETSDAVVLVTTPGAAGAVAVYVVGAHGDRGGRLRVLYRSQQLYRAVARVSRGALIVLTPEHARGDDVCCPRSTLQRTYVWADRGATFRRTSSRRVARSTR